MGINQDPFVNPEPLNTEEIAEALGADVALPVDEALGIEVNSMTTPRGMISAGFAFAQRQRRLNSKD